MNRDLKLKITFINVGNGDSILVECPGEKGCFTMLIDGGSGEEDEYRDSITGRIRAADFMELTGVKHLDVMVNTHIHEDHTCGLLPVARKWVPRQFWQPYSLSLAGREVPDDFPDAEKESTRKFLEALQDYHRLCIMIKEQGGSICQMGGNELQLCPCSGLRVKLLGPGISAVRERMEYFDRFYCEEGTERLHMAEWLDAHINNSSIIMMLECGGRKILLPGDTDFAGYGGAGQSLKADIFKVGHHGQQNGLDKKLLHAASPEYAVICASSDRRYGSADPKLLELAVSDGAKLMFTDCPEVPTYTDGLSAHLGIRFEIFSDGSMTAAYIPKHGCPVMRGSHKM